MSLNILQPEVYIDMITQFVLGFNSNVIQNIHFISSDTVLYTGMTQK
jgi:hypothetical protein